MPTDPTIAAARDAAAALRLILDGVNPCSIDTRAAAESVDALIALAESQAAEIARLEAVVRDGLRDAPDVGALEREVERPRGIVACVADGLEDEADDLASLEDHIVGHLDLGDDACVDDVVAALRDIAGVA